MHRVALMHAVCEGTNFTGCDLTKAFMDGATLNFARFRNAKMQDANLDGSFMYGALIDEAQIRSTRGEPAVGPTGVGRNAQHLSRIRSQRKVPAPRI